MGIGALLGYCGHNRHRCTDWSVVKYPMRLKVTMNDGTIHLSRWAFPTKRANNEYNQLVYHAMNRTPGKVSFDGKDGKIRIDIADIAMVESV